MQTENREFDMFRLAVLSDEIPIPPADLRPGHHIAALRRVIEEKYIDRVVRDLGLVVALYDILEIKDCFIFPGDFRDSFGEAAGTVTFRVVVFRPEIGDLLRGRVIESNTTGIRVSLGFFNDVEIPAHELMQPSAYDARSRTWMWQHDDQLFAYEINSDLIFKVKSLSIGEDSAVGDKRVVINRSLSKKIPLSPSDAPLSDRPSPPMILIGTVHETALGPANWWI